MLSRREKLKKNFLKLREQILEKQLTVVSDTNYVQNLSLMDMSAILEANHGPGVYDRLFAHSDAEVHNEIDFEMIQSRIRYVLVLKCPLFLTRPSHAEPRSSNW